MHLLIDLGDGQIRHDDGLAPALHGVIEALAQTGHSLALHLADDHPETVIACRSWASAIDPAIRVTTFASIDDRIDGAWASETGESLGDRLRARSIAHQAPDGLIFLVDADGRALAMLDHLDPSVACVATGDQSVIEACTGSLEGRAEALPLTTNADALSASLLAALDRARPASANVRVDPTSAPSASPKPRLAFVSPLSPAPTGIANYSDELLPVLAAHYQITLVTDETEVDPALEAIYGPAWSPDALRDDAAAFDRVLYQVGNASFHAFMIDLMDAVPGVSVLHDAHIGDLWLSRPDAFDVPIDGAGRGAPWAQATRAAHGLDGLARAVAQSKPSFIGHYPANWPVIERARGVIVHSRHAADILTDHYPQAEQRHCAVVPHLRHQPEAADRQAARARLGLDGDRFIVASYGIVSPHKGHDQLLEAWCRSALATQADCQLVFAGPMHPGDYGAALRKQAKNARKGGVVFTDRLSDQAFSDWVAAADVAVQLRTQSLGESSGAVMHGMAHGLPTVVNRSGSFDELPDEAVVKIDDPIDTASLARAVERLYHDPDERTQLGETARSYMARVHDPVTCARQYRDAIEAAYAPHPPSAETLVDELPVKGLQALEPSDRTALATAITASLPPARPQQRLLIDVTGTAASERITGIERVAARLVQSWLESPPAGVRVEPVRLVEHDGAWRYRTAVDWLRGLLGSDLGGVGDEWIEPGAGDWLGVVDISGDALINAVAGGLHARIRARGCPVFAVCHDILPITHPHCFPPGADRNHKRWMDAVATFDMICGTSQTVRDTVTAWLQTVRPDRAPSVRLGNFPLGGDHTEPPEAGRTSEPVTGLPDDGRVFVIVGTIEPRKRHKQVLDAFEHLWAAGYSDTLVIVGREGWDELPDDWRRDIPETIARLTDHPERDRRLLWLDRLDDAQLETVYQRADALIAASEDEGYGLPVVEASLRGVAVLSRDIPVFREVAPSETRFFEGLDGASLAAAIEQFIADPPAPPTPGDTTAAVDWRNSAERLWAQVRDLRVS